MRLTGTWRREADLPICTPLIRSLVLILLNKVHLVIGEIRVGKVCGLGDPKIFKGCFIHMGNPCKLSQVVNWPQKSHTSRRVHIWEIHTRMQQNFQKRNEILNLKREPPPQEGETCHYGLIAQSNIGPISVSQPSGEAVPSPCSGHSAYNRSGFFLHSMGNFEIKPKTYFIESAQMSVLKTF